MNNLNYWLIKIFRMSGGFLFILLFFYFLSGYGMTKEVIDQELASKFHKGILPPLVVLTTMVHSFLALRITLMRWRLWKKVTLMLMIITYLGLLGVYIHFSTLKVAQAPSLSNQPAAIAPTNLPTEKVFTKAELAQFNGQNGQPAYVAVEGVVYDVSPIYIDGEHKGHTAGEDLTTAFFSQHLKSQIEKYPRVGILR